MRVAASSPTRIPQPARATFVGFLTVLAMGTGLLMLPISTQHPGGIPFFPALFTATSALCVTGLSTVDTATYWTGFGKTVIMCLIQIGGFGVMSAATILGLTVTRKLSLSSRLNATSETKGEGEVRDVGALLRRVLGTGLLIEFVVALMLFARFLSLGYSLERALWYAAFHAVSCFNNAGFALYSDNMIGFANDPFVSLPICVGIILGGLGFPVLWQLQRHLRAPLKWTMNTRLVLIGTLSLLVLSTTYITVLEWNNSLSHLDPAGRLLAGFFQAVQTRTAGFNSVDIGAMHGVTWLGMDVLMFIGAGPAGTAGGIKITTFGVLFFIILSEIRAQDAVNVFGKRLSRSVHRQAITVALLAVALVVSATALLLALTPFSLDEVLFEACSAFGTVGLTTGITPKLNDPAQLVLVVLMFIGRLGPITVATALAAPHRQRLYDLPTERPIIG